MTFTCWWCPSPSISSGWTCPSPSLTSPFSLAHHNQDHLLPVYLIHSFHYHPWSDIFITTHSHPFYLMADDGHDQIYHLPFRIDVDVDGHWRQREGGFPSKFPSIADQILLGIDGWAVSSEWPISLTRESAHSASLIKSVSNSKTSMCSNKGKLPKNSPNDPPISVGPCIFAQETKVAPKLANVSQSKKI